MTSQPESPASPSSLDSLQRAFAYALAGTEHEPAALAVLKPAPSSTYPPGELAKRVELYRRNLRAHWRAALASAYPVLLALVGDSYFDALSLAYAGAHPSQSGDLNRFGASLPAFIEAREHDPRFRYFADVARLEWAVHVAWFAADVAVFTPQAWNETGSEALLDARLAVHPACASIVSPYAIADIWLAHQPGGVFPEHIDVPTHALVVRPLWRPTVRVHSAAAHAAFVALQRGSTLGEALDAAFAVDSGFDFASQWQAWISASAITGTADDA